MLLSLDGSPCPAPLAGGLRLPGALPAVPPRALRGLSATAPPQLPAHVKNLHFHRVFHMSRELVRFQGTDLVKVITGVRRCGKSTLLDVMREHLRSQGVPDKRLLNRKGPRGGRPRRRRVREEGVPGGHGAASQLDNPRDAAFGEGGLHRDQRRVRALRRAGHEPREAAELPEKFAIYQGI